METAFHLMVSHKILNFSDVSLNNRHFSPYLFSRTLSSSPSTATLNRYFKIYRWDPEQKQKPYLSTYPVNLDECGPMVLDALLKIKNEQVSIVTNLLLFFKDGIANDST